MFYNETIATSQVEDEPSLIFEILKEGHYDFVDKLISRGKVDINLVDERGNSLLMRLLKLGQYDIVSKYVLDSRFDINHQNVDGDTFAHILVSINYMNIIDIIGKLKRNKRFTPNIRNNKGETILDKSINNNYIYTSIKILEDERFNDIDILSFRNLCNTYIKSKKYGQYSKITNFETIVENLDKKKLLPRMEELLELLKINFEVIINELKSNSVKSLDKIINTCTVESI